MKGKVDVINNWKIHGTKSAVMQTLTLLPSFHMLLSSPSCSKPVQGWKQKIQSVKK